MKILFVQESDWMARNMHQQHHLAELMSLRGHEVRVIDYEIMHKMGLISKCEVHPEYCKIYEGAKVFVIRPSIIKLPVLDYLSLMWTHGNEIKTQVKEWQPDVIVGFGILNSYLASKQKVPFVYYWIDVLHELIPIAPLRKIGEVVEGMTLRNADKVLAINERLMDCICELGADWRKTEVLGAGVDFKKFNTKVSGKEIRERYGFKEEDTVLLFVGWLYKFSGLAEVMTRMAEVGDKSIKLVVVGDGDAYSSLLELRQKLGLINNVFLARKKPYNQIPKYIAASDICILPAYPEHRIMRNIVPIKLYEYMAMGKPVIATKILSVMKEFPIGSGILYAGTPSDVISIATQGKFREVGKKAAQTVLKCGWDSITDRFEKILKDTIKEKVNV